VKKLFRLPIVLLIVIAAAAVSISAQNSLRQTSGAGPQLAAAHSAAANPTIS